MSTANRLGEIQARIRRFYEAHGFPGYERTDTPETLYEKANASIFAHMLDAQLPAGVKILDAGCGTGQMAMFLSLSNRSVAGIDLSRHSLLQATEFRKRFRLADIGYAQMDIFHPAFRDESFDYVLCSGVLHHTGDASAGFRALCRVLKQRGYIIVGIYNTFARVLTRLRKVAFAMTNGRASSLDPLLRRSKDARKRHLWFMDQYKNPHERTFSVGDVLKWFSRNDIEYVNSIPKINPMETFTLNERLFDRHEAGNRFDHLVSQMRWIFTHSREGGLVLMIGRKRAAAGSGR